MECWSRVGYLTALVKYRLQVLLLIRLKIIFSEYFFLLLSSRSVFKELAALSPLPAHPIHLTAPCGCSLLGTQLLRHGVPKPRPAQHGWRQSQVGC